MVDSRVFTRAAFYAAIAAALIGAVALPCLAASTPGALLTIADGPVQVLRGTLRLEAVEGQALLDDDIVRTGAASAVARIEFGDGRMLDLGPATQVLLLSERAASSAGLAGTSAVLAQGWAKLTAGADGARIAAPGVIVAAGPRSSVLLRAAGDNSLIVFAEAHASQLLPRGNAVAQRVLHEGQAQLRDAQGTWSAARVRDVPRALADSLPRRAARFEGLGVDATASSPLAVDDLAPWWQAEPGLMAGLHPRVVSAPSPRKPSPAARRVTARAKPANIVAVRWAGSLPEPAHAPPPVAAIALAPGGLLPLQRAPVAAPPLASPIALPAPTSARAPITTPPNKRL